MAEETNVIANLESLQSDIEGLAGYLATMREGRRAVALAITKLDEARLWLGEAIIQESNKQG